MYISRWIVRDVYERSYKYPNDAIVASIKYFFGKYSKITQFSYGFKGTKFGIFNHVPKMIFHFALINIDLGGVLYPKKFFWKFNIL